MKTIVRIAYGCMYHWNVSLEKIIFETPASLSGGNPLFSLSLSQSLLLHHLPLPTLAFRCCLFHLTCNYCTSLQFSILVYGIGRSTYFVKPQTSEATGRFNASYGHTYWRLQRSWLAPTSHTMWIIENEDGDINGHADAHKIRMLKRR